MACVYTYNGKEYSYDKLVDLLIQTAQISPSDVLYSVEETRQDRFLKELDKMKSLGSIKATKVSTSFTTGGDPVGTATKSVQHVLQFLDDERFRADDGSYYLPQMDKDSFIKNRAASLMEEDTSLSEEDALTLAEEEFPKWDLQRQDAHIIHYIMRQFESDISTADIIHALDQLKADNPQLASRIEAIKSSSQLIDSLKSIHDKIVTTRPPGSRVKVSIPVQKVLHTEAGDVTVYDTINQAVVLQDGTIRIYQFKVSEESPQNWHLSKTPKVEKYRFELAFLKAMLEDQGFLSRHDRNDVQLWIYGIQTKYDHEGFKTSGNLALQSINPDPIVVRLDEAEGGVRMERHLSIARQFIQPALKADSIPEAIEKANAHMNRVWVGKNIQAEALGESVDQWIENHKGKIQRLENLDGPAYKVLYPGRKAIYITEKTEPENNVEMHDKIAQAIEETQEHSDLVVRSVQTAITQAYHQGYLDPTSLRGLGSASANIASTIQKYFVRPNNADGTLGEPEWEYLKDSELSDYNILLFKNRKTGQLDVVALTNLDLNARVEFKAGRGTLAGSYVSNLNAGYQLKADWGNIYGMKVAILMNYILPNLTSNSKLGELKVLTTYSGGSSRPFTFRTLVKNFYNPLMQVVQDNTPAEGAFENNFDAADFIDDYQILVNELKDIVNGSSLKEISNLADRVEALDMATGDSVRIERLTDLAKAIMEQYSLTNRSASEIAESDKIYSRLLQRISTVISKIDREVAQPVKVGKFSRFSMPTRSISSNNFKVIQKLWNETSQAINNEAYDVGLEINKLVQEYYDKHGYGYVQNKRIGNQTQQFKNLYETDSKGKLLMRFKNPYDDSNNLQGYEREFLKKALLIFAKYRYMNAGKKFLITDADGDAIKKFVEKNESWYFDVPLKKASGSSKLQTGYSIASFKESVSKIISDPKLWAREILDDKALTEYFEDFPVDKEKDVTRLSVTNYFSYGEQDISGDVFDSGKRDAQLAKHEDFRYFETNVEDLLRDFTFEAVRVQNMKKMIIGSKLFLLQMHMSGRANHNIDEFKSEFDYISDFLKTNVFGIPLMEGSELAAAAFVLPVKRLVSKMFIAGNVAGMMRDTFEGFGQIMARAVTKYGANISASNVIKAYGIVTKDMITNRPLASIISQLCIKYRMSNIDVSNVAEGMKTGTRGLFHFENELYRTLKDPDFLNRMVLFVAKAMEDGTWHAFDLNKDGELVYDWKKDARFSLLANNDKTNLELYNKQKSLFFSLIKTWNEEHPNNQIADMSTLPMPYSEKEMSDFHALSDNIWGSYDKANKAMGEHSLLMMTFGMFTTWMNGQIENYFKPLQTANDKSEWKQQRNNNNELLYYNEDGSITTEDTGVPVMIQVPIMVQGIFQTLRQIWDTIKDGESVKDEVFSSQVNRDNMKKLATDMIVTLLYYAVIKVALQAWRDKQKEVTDPHDVITNGICEVLYRGMYNAWDGFKGPLNLITFLGEQTNPPVYTETLAVAKDLYKFVAGDLTIMGFGSRHLAPIRSFKETIKAAESGKQPN